MPDKWACPPPPAPPTRRRRGRGGIRAYPRGDIYSPLINDPLSKVGGINRARNQIAVINYSSVGGALCFASFGATAISRSDEIARTKTRDENALARVTRASSAPVPLLLISRSFIRARTSAWDRPLLVAGIDFRLHSIARWIIRQRGESSRMRPRCAPRLNKLAGTRANDRSTDRGCSRLSRRDNGRARRREGRKKTRSPITRPPPSRRFSSAGGTRKGPRAGRTGDIFHFPAARSLPSSFPHPGVAGEQPIARVKARILCNTTGSR